MLLFARPHYSFVAYVKVYMRVVGTNPPKCGMLQYFRNLVYFRTNWLDVHCEKLLVGVGKMTGIAGSAFNCTVGAGCSKTRSDLEHGVLIMLGQHGLRPGRQLKHFDVGKTCLVACANVAQHPGGGLVTVAR